MRLRLHYSSSYVPLPFLLFLFLLVSQATIAANLYVEKQALLRFAAVVSHGRKLNWNSNSPICTSWVGVSCDSNATHVIALRLPGVGLYGPIPPLTLGKLNALTILSLRSNHLTGTLSPDIISLPSLRYVYLQQNHFSGNIPSSLSPQLNFLDLSSNSFTGSIPNSVQNLTYLTGLNLQNNSLTGPIPNLNLPNLGHLNLSHNRLNGSIPSSLQKFPSSSFEGNSMLCGLPLNQCPMSPSPSPSPSLTHLPPSPSTSPTSLLVPPPPSPTSLPPPPSPTFLPSSPTVPQKQRAKKKLTAGAIIAIAIGGSAVPSVLALVAVLSCLKKKDGDNGGVLEENAHSDGMGEKAKEDFSSGVQESEKNKLVFSSGVQESEKNKLVFFQCRYNFDLEDLLRASAEVMGKGSYGTSYKATLEEGIMVVVKRLKEVVVGKREFEQQMEIVAMVGQHPNIVPLRAYFHSKDEKLLVYDYMFVGSLSSLLHGM